MDIKITDSSLRHFLETKADPDTLSQNVSLCGPTFDRVQKVVGDTVYEIEAITNRVDTASSLGIAREAAVILNQFNIPAKLIHDPYKEEIGLHSGKPKQFHFEIDDNLCVRFSAVAIEGVKVKKSPTEIQELLENCGQRPINNLVDITNELTILYGLPSHVFDLDKLAAQKLSIRKSNKGEVITTLDDTSNTLQGGDIVIEDGQGRLVDLCGIMGGQVAEVDEHTKRILLIVPVYKPKNIRKTSLYLQKRTLAAQIYEKQPDPELTLPIISIASKLFKERSGGHISSEVYDYYPNPFPPKKVDIDLKWLNSFVGIEIDETTVLSILAGLGFGGTANEGILTCHVPSWRYHDINIPEDMVEEIARVYGYHKLPPVLPCVAQFPDAEEPLFKEELKAKKFLSAIGYHEIYNSSLTSENTISSANLNPENHLKLKNALTEDYQYLRTNITPSLLENYRHNQGKTEEKFRVYELANCYFKKQKDILPSEISTLAIVTDLDYRHAKGELESLLDHLRVKNVTFNVSQEELPFFSTGSCANIFSDKTIIGQIGSVAPVILRNFNITGDLVCIEINFENLSKNVKNKLVYQPISEHPELREVMTINTNKKIGDIIKTIKSTSKLIRDVSYVESYGDKHTFKVSFGSLEENLHQTEVNKLKDIILQRLKS